MWWDSQVLWAGAAGLVTATLSGLGALIYGRRQNRPAIAHAHLPAAVEDLTERVEHLCDHLATQAKDVDRLGDTLTARLDALDDQVSANARMLSELKGMLNAMMMALAR